MVDIPLTPIKSSMLQAHGYDHDTRTMRIQYHNGAIYDHPDVPFEKYHAFTGAQSPGGFFNKKIRPHHTGTKLAPDKAKT